MHAKKIMTVLICGLLVMTVVATWPQPAAATDSDLDAPLADSRAGWLLARTDGDIAMLGTTGLEPEEETDDSTAQPTEIGGKTYEPESDEGGSSPAVPMVMSAILPGLGEAYRGHKRGYVLMALDIAAWIGGFHYKNEGEQLRDDYYAYADAHWREDKLAAAYNNPPPGGYDDADLQYVELFGRNYFPVQDYRELDLWVSKEDDYREYYENLGKWDQFVFGWDDFVRADDPLLDDPYGPGYVDWQIDDLRQEWTSSNRDTYRQMRTDSNDAFEKQDTFLYVNIFLRVFSVLEVAYLEGLMGGGGSDNELKVSGHPISIIAETSGWHSSRFGAAVDF